MSDVKESTDTGTPPVKEEVPDLNSLLAEWKEEPKEEAKVDQTPPKLDPEKVRGALSYVEQLQQKDIRDQTDKALQQTVGNIIAATPDLEGVPPTLVRSFLHMKADESADLRAAWVARNEKPEMWKKMEAALAKEFSAEWSKVPQATVAKDRQAVQAAVRNLSSTPPRESPPDLNKMSMREIRALASGKAR
jgi:hypothetical protein